MRIRSLPTLALFAISLTGSSLAAAPMKLAFDHVAAVPAERSAAAPWGGCGMPRTLAAADFDEDGVADLAVGCSEGSGGAVALYRGEEAALYASGLEALRPRAPFAAAPALFPLSEPAELLAAGDFDGDGHQDLLAAGHGSLSLLFLRGSGRGALAPELNLPGPADEAHLLDLFRRGPSRPSEAVPPPGTFASLPLRLNRDAVPDLVLIEKGAAGPTALVSRSLMTFTVNSTADTTDGVCDATNCTLREAILAANANPGLDTIAFNLSGTPPHTIGILSDLPNVLEAVTIDGRTEPDFSGTPVVVLDGVATAGPQGLGIPIAASGSTVRGLAVYRFATHSAIVLFNNSSGGLVEGNFVGTNAAGTTAVGTGGGIDLASSSNNTIGGTAAAARNLVAGATLPAIIVRLGSSNTTIQGNYLGLDVTGLVPLRNVGNEVAIFDSESTTLGGVVAGARNVIAGNTDAASPGVAIANLDALSETNATNNLVQGNYIGTDATGNTPIGSASVAVYIQDASNNTVGGATAGAGNIIGGGGLGGVRVLAPAGTATGNLIAGNHIGLGANGTAPLPSADNGVRFSHGASGNTLANNIIANAALNGVLGRYDSGTGNQITANRLFGNGRLGIDLTTSSADPGGPTANDAGDGDSGPNGLQNFPVLSAANHLTGQVNGTLDSAAGANFTIELFMSPSCDGSGHGEGMVLIGSGPAMTNGSGLASFSLTATSALALGQFLTATATDAAGSTSEFSACFEITNRIFTDGFESGTTATWSQTVL